MIDISVLISVLSVAFAIYMGIANMKRNKATDDKKEATELTTVIVKLENIADDTKEIKNELRNVKAEVGGLRERVVKAEEVGKSLHKRVDRLEERLASMKEE